MLQCIQLHASRVLCLIIACCAASHCVLCSRVALHVQNCAGKTLYSLLQLKTNFLCAGSQRVLSTSRDDSLRVWDAKKELTQLSSFHHYNNTGRWVVPFRAVWGAASDTVICGSMKRTVSLVPVPFVPGPPLNSSCRCYIVADIVVSASALPCQTNLQFHSMLTHVHAPYVYKCHKELPATRFVQSPSVQLKSLCATQAGRYICVL